VNAGLVDHLVFFTQIGGSQIGRDLIGQFHGAFANDAVPGQA
jgi:hypothetical protein